METNLSLVFLGKEKSDIRTNSLIVSEQFGKRHHRVLRAVQDIIKGLTKNGETQDMFFKTTYIHEQNKQEYPVYEMTRDGFSLLVMGFTGTKALKFKTDFINAFNKMEEMIRTGSSVQVPQFDIPQTFSQALLLAARQAEQIENQQKLLAANKFEIEQLNNAVKSMEKKVTYLDVILNCPETVLVTTIAQDYGMTPIRFNELLHKIGIQHKVGDQWVLYSKFIKEGFVKSVSFTYTRSNGQQAVKNNTQWTQKGRKWLYEYLKTKNIFPVIEQPDMNL